MKSFAAKCVEAGVVATVLLLPCSFLAVSNDGGPVFLAAAGACVIILCSLVESFFPSRREHGFWLSLTGGIGRGALVGLCAWAVMMFLVSISSEPGDKFGIYVLFFGLAPAILGAIAGGIARLIASRKRKMERNSSSSTEVQTLSRTNGAN